MKLEFLMGNIDITISSFDSSGKTFEFTTVLPSSKLLVDNFNNIYKPIKVDGIKRQRLRKKSK